MTTNIRKIVFFVLLLGVTYLAYRYMIKPANESLNKQRVRLDEKVEKLKEVEKVTAAAKDISQQLNQLEKAIQFFENRLPPKNQIYEVLESVTLIAQKRGLKPKTIKTFDQEHKSEYVEQPLTLELQGSFNSFYSFLLDIEKLPRIMKMRDIELKKQPKNEGEINAKCVVSIFFQNEETG